MITSQDVRAKSFEKAVFGGYDMSLVDEYMEAVARSMDESARELSTLKSKMIILANKVEEYRSTEEAMRLALVSAQQLASQIEADAREKADAIVTDATAQSVEILADLKKQVATEEAKLAAAQSSFAKFLQDALAMCRDQIAYLEDIPEEMTGGALPDAAPAAPEAPEVPVAEELPEAPELTLFDDPAVASDDFAATLLFSLD